MVTGQDLQGEELGAWRWLGLLDFIPFAGKLRLLLKGPGDEILSAIAGGTRATNARPVLGQIDDVLRQQLQRTAGFADEGMPIIVDNSLGVNPNLVAKELRAQGYNARSVTEIFGPDPGDLSIGQLADQLGGRVLTVDKTGFPTTGFRIDGRIQSVDSVLRLIQEAGL